MLRSALVPLILLCVSPAEAGDVVETLKDETEVQFVDTPVVDAMKFLSDLHQVPIVIDEAALKKAGLSKDEPVTLELSGVSVASVLNLVLYEQKMEFRIQGQTILIVPEGPKPKPGEKPAGRIAEAPAPKVIVDALKQKSTLEFDKTPLREAATLIADLHGIPVVLDERGLKERKIDPGKAPVTYTSEPNAILGTSLRSMLDPMGLEAVIRNEVLLITPRPLAPPRKVRVPGP